MGRITSGDGDHDRSAVDVHFGDRGLIRHDRQEITVECR